MEKSPRFSGEIPVPEENTIGAERLRNVIVPRVLPFAVFMALIGVDELAGFLFWR